MKYLKIVVHLLFLFLVNTTFSQQFNYTTTNAHSHNDYENANPFFTAYDNNFGSIEADIFYFKDSLFVGHVFGDIAKKRTLQNFYLNPLTKKIQENHGNPYADSTKTLQLLIDIKSDPYITLY